MSPGTRLRSWPEYIVQRSRMESEIEDELGFHIERCAHDLVRTRVPHEEAMRGAGS